MSFASAYNMARARALSESIGEWKVLCANLEATNANLAAEVEEKKYKIDVWRAHYAGIEAERDYLLRLIDEKCGGADKNPARALADEEYRIPNGPRKGEKLQKRDVVYLKRIADLGKSKMPQFKNWWKLVCDWKIFD
ncbi:hypothetical protein OCH239_09770 [Roseivivax halodurans JCM 10272]|uniref:Uncharacterized protein n=1 Tax=Roseivivax halodurans JCM 10272 TaxID=1449350 RepID=X7EC93_9RHOB|nr:hypothetical protein [Roseivivax halodurans]ETX13557.1 hypothetical protein OCH239_09770 [Roseivivax halodurans JCM 10272]